MKRIAILLALMLVLGTVLISGCVMNQNTQNTSGNSSGSNSSGIPGYSIGQVINVESGNNAADIQSDNKINP